MGGGRRGVLLPDMAELEGDRTGLTRGGRICACCYACCAGID